MLEPSQIKSNSISSLLINEFFNFIEIGYLEGVKECLSRTPELLDIINSETHHSALNAATYYGQKPLVEFFLAQGISLDAGIAPNAEAYAEFHQKLDIKALIENARRSRTSFNPTPLDDDEVLQIAMQESFTTSLPPDTIEDPHQKYINLLLDKSINNSEITRLLKLYPHFINETETNKLTGLHVAVLNNNFELIKFLVDRQANLNGQDTYGNTPLHLAALRGNEGAVIYLISNGANPVIKNNDEKTVAEIAHQHEHLMLSQRIRDFTPPSAASRLPTTSVIPSIFHNPQKPSGTTQKLFKHDLERQREYLEAILMLKKILKYITGFDDNLDKIGYNKAEIIYEQFPLLYIDLIQNNPNNIETPLLIAKLPLIDCQRRLIIYFTETLMNIIYKYGRQNFEKEPMHNHAKYLINKGLINYVMELKRNPSLMSTDIFREILQEIKQEFPIIIEFFLLNQLKQPINDTTILYDELVNELTEITLKIYKIKLVNIYNNLTPPKVKENNFLKNKLNQFQSLKEDLLKNKLAIPKIEDIDAMINLINHYLELQKVPESNKKSLEENKKNLEKLIQYWQQDIMYLKLAEKKTKKISIKKEEIDREEQFEARSTLLDLERELKSYAILSESEINEKNIQLQIQKDLLSTWEIEFKKLTNKKRDILYYENSRNKFPENHLNYISWDDDVKKAKREYDEIKNKFQENRINIDELRLNFAYLETQIDIQFEEFRLKNKDINLEKKIEILLETEKQLEEINTQLNAIRLIEQFFILSKYPTSKQQKLKFEEELNQQQLKLQEKKESDNNKNILNNYDVENKKINQLNKEIKKLKMEIDEYHELLLLYNQLTELEQIKNKLEQELPNLKLVSKIPTVSCFSLRNYNEYYEKQNLQQTLFDFYKQCKLANNLLEIIGLLTDFSRWWHDGCSESLKHKISTILPFKTITRVREIRNKIMHCFDWTEGSQFIMSQKLELTNILEVLKIIIKHLHNNTNNLIFNHPLIEMSLAHKKSCVILLENSINQFPNLPSQNRDESHRVLPPSSEHQVDIFINSVNTGKALLQLIATELAQDAAKGIDLETISKAFNQQYDLSCIIPQDEALFRLRWKYDGLLQALGETLGNLQQYKEMIPDIEKLDILLIETFIQLHYFVPLAKEYRSVRTHTLYQNLILFKALLDITGQDVQLLCNQLDQLFNRVKDSYLNSKNDIIRELAKKFDSLSSPGSITINCSLM